MSCIIVCAIGYWAIAGPIHCLPGIQYSSTLTLHSHVNTRVFSPAFCMKLLNISRVINFYSQFWHAHVCIFFEKCTYVHEYILYEYTDKCTSRVHSHARDTSRVYFVIIHLTCALGIYRHMHTVDNKSCYVLIIHRKNVTHCNEFP